MSKLFKLASLLMIGVFSSVMFLPASFGESPVPSVTFEVGANDFPSHGDYTKIKVMPNAYVNVYDIAEDATLGYYKGVLKQTLATGDSGMAEVVVEDGEMVNFLTFKTQADAQKSEYATWKFSTPPYKNFSSEDKLCQTNFFDFDNFLKNSESYACAMSLTSPYQVVSTSSVWLDAVSISAKSENGEINLDWSPLAGVGYKFDKYNVLFKKGYYKELSADSAKSYVSFDYYNLTGLNPGDWWTFQVVPVKNANGVYTEVGAKSNVLQVQVKSAVNTADLDTPYMILPYANQVLTNYPREALLKWKTVENATKYEIEVACDVCVSTETKWLQPTKYTSLTNSFKTPPLAGDNEFRVRVKAIDDKNYKSSNWSPYVYFRYDTSGYTTPVAAYAMNLAITTWDENGLPRVEWSAFDGEFDGYAMFVREGVWNEHEVTWEDQTYFNSNQTAHQMVKMKEYTNYTVRILPYIQREFSREFVYPGSNTLVFTTGAAEDKWSSGQNLPPAGYEDEVITAFNTYTNPFADTDLAALEGKAAAELFRRAVIGGFPDGEFKGTRDVNRAELAKFLLLARYGTVEDVSNSGQFPDVKEGEWYVKYVVTAANMGIIKGHPDGAFRPANAVNVAEFLKMLSLTFQLESNLPYSYDDVTGDEWFASYVGVAQKYNLFPGKTRNLNPAEYMSRYQVAVAIYQFLLNR